MEPPPGPRAVGGGRENILGVAALNSIPRCSQTNHPGSTGSSDSLAAVSRRLPAAVLALFLLASCFAASASGAARFYTPDYGQEPVETIGGFDLGADGSLTPIPGSPFPAADPGPGGLWSLAFTPDGTRAISGLFFTGGVRSYRVLGSGAFEQAGKTPTASPTAVAITPDGRYAFASTRDFSGMPPEGIRRFAVNADGSLAPLAPSGGSGEYASVAITPDGRFLFALASNSIERFTIGAVGSLAFLGTTS